MSEAREEKKDSWFVKAGPFNAVIPANWKGAIFMLVGIMAFAGAVHYALDLKAKGHHDKADILGVGAFVGMITWVIIASKKTQRV